MKSAFSFLCLVLVLLGISAHGQPQKKQDHPVKELYLSTIQAYNDGNLELFLANFSPDIRMYGTDGNYVGKQALRNRFEAIF